MLVGRESEWRAAQAAWESLTDGSQVLEVVGEPGIGKTRLLAEIARQTRDSLFRTLTGRATEFESELPFAVIIEALDHHVRKNASLLQSRLTTEDIGRLGSILDGLPDGSEVYAGERYRTLRAIRQLLEILAEPSGLVLILDDVHWCDAATIDLIDYLIRQPPDAPVLLVLAYRPAQAPARLASSGRRLTLGPLSEADVEHLLGTGPAEAARLTRLSGGNPLYLDALRRYETTSAGTVRTLDDLDPAIAALPAEVRVAFSAELSALDPDSRLLASAAAVGGDECEPALLAVIAELRDATVLRCLDDLVARDLMQAVPGTGRFRFRHPLVRHVVYASAAAGWRLAAHARAAAYLEGVGAPPRARAHHVARSATLGDARAATVLVDAAQAVGPQAPATAAYWAQAALCLLPGDTAEAGLPSRADLSIFLAERQAASGFLTEARKTMGTVLDVLLAPGDPARPAAVGYTGLLLRLIGQHEEAEALLAAEPPDPDVLLQLATYALIRGHLYEADERLHRASELAAPGSAVAAIAQGIRSMTGVEPPLKSTAALLDTLSDDDIAARLDVCAWMCWSSLDAEGTSDSLRRLRRCRQIAVRFGHSFVLPYLLAMQALMQARLGRITDAMRDADEAVGIARMLAADEPLSLALLTKCWLLKCATDHAGAIDAGEQAVAAATAGRGWLSTAQAMLAFARLASGDHERGAADLIAAGGGPSLTRLYPHNRTVACISLSALATDPASARHWADLAETVGASNGGAALLARALAEGIADPVRGGALAEAAAALLTEVEQLVMAARAWLAAVTMHQRSGDFGAARTALTRAEQLNGRMDCAEISAGIQQLTHRLLPPVGLTPRESEIAALIADGRSNTEIAAKLHLSIRTVETHASRIYTKLGVPTRAAAVSRLAS
ncbi:ATP-binding protein [Paractinoplanes bogorensis]|nr:LuxR family transcriptional regulator [Actinoplanes bogorensis]